MTNSADIKRMKVKRDVVIRWYVRDGNDIYGGPFDTKEEAEQCLAEAQQIDAQHPIEGTYSNFNRYIAGDR